MCLPFTDTQITLSGGQTVDAQVYQDNNTWEDPGCADRAELVCQSRTDVEVRVPEKHGLPKTTSKLGAKMRRRVEHATRNLRHVLEGPFLGTRHVPSWSLMMSCVCARQPENGT